jgi:hypothetical protein
MPDTSNPNYVTVVPIYKATPSKTEAYSLLQLRYLGIHNATLMCPEDLDVGVYLDLWPDIKIQRFPKEYFLSVQTYNDFLLRPAFYEVFSGQYNWMVIYQLDAFIFSDQVAKFCKLGFDYYGAPWRVGFPQYHFLLNRWPIRLNMRRFYVGNGGFSLRKLDSTIDLLHRKQGHKSQTYFMEDVFFGYWGSVDKHFHACPAEVGAAFSIETYPYYWVKLIDGFPMGTHNFERSGKEWAKDFYSPILSKCYEKLSEAFPKLQSF